jgi:glycosyltransferase involved in cell wall biosynthesis
MLHSTLEGRVQEEGAKTTPAELAEVLHRYIETIGGHVVATSMYKGESWGFTEDVVFFGIDADEYYVHTGREARGLRICNFIENKRKILMWDFHEKAFAGLPVRLVGHNPTLPGVTAADSWDHLKKLLQCHRFYIHTAEPRYEAGFNMASVEAMAAGLPVIGNNHPTSPIKHGVSGFLSDKPAELRKFAMMLLEDKKLANLMGQQARKAAIEQFSLTRFRQAFLQSIETARQKWQALRLRSPAYDLQGQAGQAKY